MIIGNPLLLKKAADSTPADPVTRSLRFNDGDNSHLYFDPTATHDSSTVYTFSCWAKLGEMDAESYEIFTAGDYTSSTDQEVMYFGHDSNSKLRVWLRSTADGANTNYRSTAVFRDPSAWYHLLLVRNGASLKVYVNNSEVISETISATQRYGVGNGYPMHIGSSIKPTSSSISDYGSFDGLLADVYFTDGHAKVPTDFIEDAGYGAYKPKEYTGEFGTNGFHVDGQPSHDSDLLVSSVGRNDGDTTFVDVAKGHTITDTGDPEHSIKVGNPFTGDDKSIYWNNTEDCLQTDSSTDFALGTDDCTIEFWFNAEFSGSWHLPIASSDTSLGPFLYFRSDKSIYIYQGANTSWWTSPSNTVKENQWQHFAFCRKTISGTTYNRMWVDGKEISPVASASTTYSWSWGTSAQSIKIAANNYDNFKGYLHDVRVIKGTAAYWGSGTNGAGDITVPTEKLAAVTNTKLLIQPTPSSDSSWSDIDKSGVSGRTISHSNSVAYADPTASTPYEAAAKSTAMYFDGNGDTIVAAASSDFAFGTGDFTVEGWWYFESIPSSTDAMLVDFRPNNNNDTDTFAFSTDTTNGVKVYSGGNHVLGGSLSTNTWHHIALVRDSGTLYAYIDGTATGTTPSFSSNLTANSTPRLGTTADGGLSAAFTGYVFDVRITKGTARYTSNFTAPSAPFELNPIYIGGDQSGNKNHFEPTGISSHDVMLDTPTKNYCTLNPLDKHSNISIEQGNLKTSDSVTGGNNYDGIRGTIGLPKTGKWYWECRLSTESYITGLGIADGSGDILGSQNAPSKRNYLGVGSWFRIYNSNTPKHMINQNGTSGSDWSQASNPSQSGGSIYMVAVDMDNGTAWWGKDGSWFANSSGTTANPASNAGAQATGLNDGTTWFPFSQQADQSAEAAMAFNFGADNTFAGSVTSGQDTSQSEFYYAPPTDSDGNPFKSLNTSNLPDPSVTPSEHFDVATYSGNGTNDRTNAVSLEFQPDLVWVKSRTSSQNHYLQNSVVGATSYLVSNNDGVENQYSSYGSSAFNSFTSDGFELNSDSAVGMANTSGQTYVAWNWKAHQTPTSARTTYTVKVEDASGDAWDASSSFYDSSTYLPNVYMELWENRSSGLVSIGKVAVRSLDESGNSVSDLSEQTYELKCVDLNAITVKWHYDTSGDGQEYDYPNSYNDYLNEQKITILDGSTSEWTTNNHSNDDGGTNYNYSPPSGWANGDSLKSATTSYTGSDTATLTSGSGPVEKYNASAGFTMIKYAGDGSTDGDTQTLDHSLGVPLEFVIVKGRTNNDSMDSGDWVVWHKDLSSGKFLRMNSTAAQDSESSSNTLIATTTSGLQHRVVVNNGYANTSGNAHYLNSGPDNGTGDDYILYGFAGVEGYSKFGAYEGNGSTDGPFIYTGFRPRWIMVKPIDDPYAWYIHDTARSPYNYSDNELVANTSGAEYSVSGAGAGERFDILSNGFKHRTSNVAMNANNKTMVYAAFAESPFKYANAR